jgi:hypothetical protein
MCTLGHVTTLIPVGPGLNCAYSFLEDRARIDVLLIQTTLFTA